jgi:CheY-like chemotaxis protein
MLHRWEMAPAEAASGQAALELMEKSHREGKPFDLVLLDNMMPGMDGFTLARTILRRSDLAGGVLMMLSSSDRGDDAARCRELGIDAYLTKPVRRLELFHALIEALHSRTAVHEPGAAELQSPPSGFGEAARSLRLLLAEDNAVNQKLATRLLEKRGHVVQAVSCGAEAVEAARQQAYDAILMDVEMPEMDGFEATRRIRELEAELGRRTPIIAMTAHAMKGDRERCLAAGMDDYVSKPLRPTALFGAVESLAGEPKEKTAPSVEPAPRESLIDRKKLLESFGNDEELLREVIEVFVGEYPALLSAVDQALVSRDREQLRQSVHKLKGAISPFSRQGAYPIGVEVEKTAATADWDALEKRVADFKSELARLVPALSGQAPSK